ncbi:MAG: hypothetical protein IK990_02695 [Ruminiclostridium sp.]|nr:hypothetical protein [Ruminiclostridium sp.]
MFSTKCGKETENGTLFCPNCGERLLDTAYTQGQSAPYSGGYSFPQQPEYESPALAICALVFTFIFPLVGLILGIVGLKKYKVRNRGMCIASVVVSAVFLLIYLAFAAILIPSMQSYIQRSKQARADMNAAAFTEQTRLPMTEGVEYPEPDENGLFSVPDQWLKGKNPSGLIIGYSPAL